jgi:hypothetical protein
MSQFYSVFFVLFAFNFGAQAQETSLLKIKSPTLNTRSSPGVERKNQIKGCTLKKGENYNATEFSFIKGVPWCRIEVMDRPDCPKDQEIWIIGSKKYISEVAPPIFQDMIPESLQKQEDTAATFCASCLAKAKKPLMNLSLRSVKFGPPIGMTLCKRDEVPKELEDESDDELPAEEECNCRGITSEFGYRMHPVKKKQALHRGLDLGAPRGTPVYATADGVVTASGRNGGYGNRIEVQHFDDSKPASQQILKDKDDQIVGVSEGQALSMRACGISREKIVDSVTSTYNHLQKIEPGIQSGTLVKKGQLIGYVGKTGLSDNGYHLHFETKVEGMGCHVGPRADSTCDPSLFFNFPEKNPKWERKYTCLQRKPE